MNGYRPMPPSAHASDAELMHQVAAGSEEALGLLHRRFARLVFGLAVQTLDRAAAEDLVQEVFLDLRPGAGLGAGVAPADRALPHAERAAPPEPAARDRAGSRGPRARQRPRTRPRTGRG